MIFLGVSSWELFLSLSVRDVFLTISSWDVFLVVASRVVFLNVSSRGDFLTVSSREVFLIVSSRGDRLIVSSWDVFLIISVEVFLVVSSRDFFLVVSSLDIFLTVSSREVFLVKSSEILRPLLISSDNFLYLSEYNEEPVTLLLSSGDEVLSDGTLPSGDSFLTLVVENKSVDLLTVVSVGLYFHSLDLSAKEDVTSDLSITSEEDFLSYLTSSTEDLLSDSDSSVERFLYLRSLAWKDLKDFDSSVGESWGDLESPTE